ncbi:MAG: (4Fe-4S)-binding protein [Salinisphaeraceae bacterium]|nr:(4Fe-4S)-binding protein [Salinisphaeraceae bacterium]
MSKPVQTYEGEKITVSFDPNVCTHAARCVKGLPTVFNINNKPWISVDAAPADVVENQVAQCPSGALSCRRK